MKDGGRCRDAARRTGAVRRRGSRANGKAYRGTVRNGMTDT
ncbi:hypothetical protein L810_1919 [Burkholderia sp. AU4i]|nr:hypothetical protein L810_1919 [Burkholderia sp. AU4i]